MPRPRKNHSPGNTPRFSGIGYADGKDVVGMCAIAGAVGLRVDADTGKKMLGTMAVSYTHLTLPTICSV